MRDGRRDRGAEEHRERRPREPFDRAQGERVSDLAEDLRLAEHERVETGRDATEVPRDVLSRVDVEMVEQELARNVVRRRERVDELVARILDAGGQPRVQLHAVARLEHGVLEDRRAALGAKPERADALAQLDGGRAMTQSEADEAVHAARSYPWALRSTTQRPRAAAFRELRAHLIE